MINSEANKSIGFMGEEVSELLGRSSSKLTFLSSVTIITVVSIFLTGLFLVRYPQSITAKIEIMHDICSAQVYVNNNGYIERLFVNDGDTLGEGDPILLLHNSAKLDHIKKMEIVLNDFYDGRISIGEFRNEILASDYQLGDVGMNFSLLKHFLLSHNDSSPELLSYCSEVSNSIFCWYKKYLLSSPIDGVASFLPSLMRNQYVSQGDLICIVSPLNEIGISGWCTIGESEITKIEEGDNCSVIVNRYPREDYGNIEGLVESIGNIPVSEDTYLVKIKFPDGLKSNTGYIFKCHDRLMGTVLINAKEIKLWDIVVNPLMSIFEDEKKLVNEAGY